MYQHSVSPPLNSSIHESKLTQSSSVTTQQFLSYEPTLEPRLEAPAAIKASNAEKSQVHQLYMEYISKIKLEGMLSKDNFESCKPPPSRTKTDPVPVRINYSSSKLKPPFKNIEQIFKPLYTQIESEKFKEGIIKSLALSLAQSKTNSRLDSGTPQKDANAPTTDQNTIQVDTQSEESKYNIIIMKNEELRPHKSISKFNNKEYQLIFESPVPGSPKNEQTPKKNVHKEGEILSTGKGSQ